MIAAISLALGLLAVQFRSPLAYAAISFMIFIAFGAAALTAGGTRWLLLGQALLFFNLGIVALVVVMTLVETARRRRDARG